jgi:hypothetical protein
LILRQKCPSSLTELTVRYITQQIRKCQSILDKGKTFDQLSFHM